jgi:hypothetical protein
MKTVRKERRAVLVVLAIGIYAHHKHTDMHGSHDIIKRGAFCSYIVCYVVQFCGFYAAADTTVTIRMDFCSATNKRCGCSRRLVYAAMRLLGVVGSNPVQVTCCASCVGTA